MKTASILILVLASMGIPVLGLAFMSGTYDTSYETNNGQQVQAMLTVNGNSGRYVNEFDQEGTISINNTANGGNTVSGTFQFGPYTGPFTFRTNDGWESFKGSWYERKPSGAVATYQWNGSRQSP